MNETEPVFGNANRWDRAYGIVALACLAAMVFLAKASDSTLPATDAATHADLAMSATANGWIPKFPIGAEKLGGHWGPAGFNDHPFLFFYLSGWIMRALGPDAWSAKLLPAAMSIGCVLMTVWLGKTLRSYVLGFVAAAILLFSREFMVDGLNAHLDNGMLFFILASFIAWNKDRPILAGALAGMGIWFKSPVAFLLFPAMTLVHLVRFEILSKFKPLILSFLTAVLVGSLVWIVTGVLGGWDLVQDYWVRQLWGTAVGGRGGQQAFDPFAFVQILRSHYMPWSVLLVIGIVWSVLTMKFRKLAFLVPFFGALVLIAAISVIRFKYDHYFVPAYPFLSLLAAMPLAVFFEKYEATFYRGFAMLALIVGTVVLSSPIQPSPESFPALKRFMALIQSYGDCRDRVVFVEGGQPYALPYDYEHLIHFYTGRKFVSTTCLKLQEAAKDPDARWILIFGKNVDECLGPDLRRAYPQTIYYGSQALLARGGLPDFNSVRVELTPLGRELKAVTDCRPAALPKDRYHSYF